MILILVAALFGNLSLLVFDPITLFTRIMTTAILPALNYAVTSVERVLYPVAVHYKGSGFYSTDYGRGNRKPSKDGSDSSSSSSGDSSSSSSSSSGESSSTPEKKAAAAD